jgi:Stress responsive A/B Barrel Domain
VIDRSYDYCELTIFNDEAGHDIYQVHPLHLKFIDECKNLWEKVLIYDSETV